MKKLQKGIGAMVVCALLVGMLCGQGVSVHAALKTVTPAEIVHCYSALDAVTYAETWYDGFNPDYTNYSSSGGDCANFASQCVFAGGLKTTTSAQTTNSWTPGRTLWTSSSNLRNFLRTVSYATVVDGTKTSLNVSNLRNGDLIFYRWNGYSIENEEYTYHHTGVIYTKDSGVKRVYHHSYSDGETKWNLDESCKISLARIIRYGDVDGSEDVDSTDARLLLQYAVGKIDETALNLTVGDIDYSGSVDSTDARLAEQFAVGKL